MMKKYLIYILFILVLLCGCSQKKEKYLNVTIPQETMASIIKDITKANYIVSISNITEREQKIMQNNYKESICNHYKITKEIYDHDLKQYLQHEDIMQKILEKAKQ